MSNQHKLTSILTKCLVNDDKILSYRYLTPNVENGRVFFARRSSAIETCLLVEEMLRMDELTTRFECDESRNRQNMPLIVCSFTVILWLLQQYHRSRWPRK